MLKRLLGGKPFVFTCSIANETSPSVTTDDGLADTGANGYVFVSADFARRLVESLHLSRDTDFRVRRVGGHDGSSSQAIEAIITADITVQGRRFPQQPMMIIHTNHDLILGRKWLEAQDILVDIKRRRLLFPGTDERAERETQLECLRLAKANLPCVEQRMAELEASLALPSPVGRTDDLNKIRRPSSLSLKPTFGPSPHHEQEEVNKMERQLQKEDVVSTYDHGIRIMALDEFLEDVEHDTIAWTTIGEIDDCIEEQRTQREKTPEEKMADDLKEVPDVYNDYLDVFSKENSNTLTDYRGGYADHRIELIPGKKPEELGYSPLYKMSLEELEVCRNYVLENLAKGWITPSNAPWAAPVLLAKKANGGLRFCVDYRKLNSITVKDRYPLPLIEETLTRIGKAKIFTKLDIRQAFHRLRLAPEHEDLSAFRTRYGAYKYKVLPFGLCNGPASFQRYINGKLIGYLDKFCSAYIDDILIYSDNVEEHTQHVRLILERLREANLQVDIKKCEFGVTHTKYLGFIIGTDGVSVDPAKIEAVTSWERPRTVKGVQAFLGFCNFYRKFVKAYGRVALPLTALTKKNRDFEWTEECEAAFQALKQHLSHAPILRHFEHGRPTRVETDASDGVLAGVLLQKHGDDWFPTAYFSENMQGPELNYSAQDKEMLAVVRALVCWRAELVGLQAGPFLVVTDHEALKYFTTKRLLNSRQAAWADLLAEYNFQITYRPGTENVLADSLSRKGEELRTQLEKRHALRTRALFKPVSNLNEPSELSEIAVLDDADPPECSGYALIDKVLQANQHSEELAAYRDMAVTGSDTFTLLDNRILTCNGRLAVPEEDDLRTKIIEECHSRITTAHPGRNKTRRLVAERYWWPGLMGDVDRFTANCTVCHSSKVPRDKTPGLLKPLPIPLRGWQSLAVDFKSMPRSKRGYDNAFVVIDRLSKAVWTTPCKTTATARDAACMYYNGPYRLLGLPKEVVSDRGPQFIADFTNEMSRICGVKWKLASSGHSQTAGQAENMNENLDQRLRPFVNHFQDNWDIALPAMDSVQNNLPHDSTGLAPREVLMGWPTDLPFDWKARSKLNKSDMPRTERLNRKDAQDIAKKIQEFIDMARKQQSDANERSARQANRHRREPDFKVGDRVFIIRQTVHTDRPSDKLDRPLTEQHYRIREMNGHSYKLEVPPGWKGTDTFHADRLRLYPNNPLPGQAPEEPGPVIVDGAREWVVDHIESSKVVYGTLYYQVCWRGWGSDPVWYRANGFKNAATKLKEYHDQYPEKSGPPLRLDDWLRAAAEDRFDPDHPDDDRPAPGGGITRLRRSNRKRK